MTESTTEPGDTLDWAEESDRPDGYPMMATAIAVLAILAIAVTQARSERSLTFGMGLLAATAIAILLWAIAYLATLRHTTVPWRGGSFAIIWVVALLASIWAINTANAALRYDMTMVAELEANSDGTIILPEHPDRGLMSRAMIRFVKAGNQEVRQRTQMLRALGLNSLGSADIVTRFPSLLNDCGRFERTRPQLSASIARTSALFASFRAEVLDSAIQPAFKREFLNSFDTLLRKTLSDVTRSESILGTQLGVAGEICTILARRRWKAQARTIVAYGRVLEVGDRDLFAFSDRGDERAYKAAGLRWEALREQGRRLHSDIRSGSTPDRRTR